MCPSSRYCTIATSVLSMCARAYKARNPAVLQSCYLYKLPKSNMQSHCELEVACAVGICNDRGQPPDDIKPPAQEWAPQAGHCGPRPGQRAGDYFSLNCSITYNSSEVLCACIKKLYNVMGIRLCPGHNPQRAKRGAACGTDWGGVHQGPQCEQGVFEQP